MGTSLTLHLLSVAAILVTENLRYGGFDRRLGAALYALNFGPLYEAIRAFQKSQRNIPANFLWASFMEGCV